MVGALEAGADLLRNQGKYVGLTGHIGARLIARASPRGRCFSNPEATSVGADLSAVYREGSRGDHARVTRHSGNRCRMLDLQRGGHLFRYHAGRLGPG